MILYSRELESFEQFCKNEFQLLFEGTEGSIAAIQANIETIQKTTVGISPAAPLYTLQNAQFKSIDYSFFSGGKRFRPLLSFASSEYFGYPITKVYPWAMSIEMIHTYSLIHDDLPSMDNDDFRRGQPTNHKVFGEAVALLSGDALLTEAFALLAKHYSDSSALLPSLITNLAQMSGLNGMILGQYFDISLKTSDLDSITNLNKIMLLKTGALISAAFTGPALLKNWKGADLKSVQEIGFLLGYAFQIKDDILDSTQDKGSKKNLSYYFQDKSQLELFLQTIHHEIEKKIAVLDLKLKLESGRSKCLTQFLSWNLKREK